MGDIADWVNDSMQEAHPEWMPVGSRRTRWAGFGRDPRYNEESRTTECKRCGKGGLRWHKEDGRWVLMESQYKVHHCDTSKVADDFDVVQP